MRGEGEAEDEQEKDHGEAEKPKESAHPNTKGVEKGEEVVHKDNGARVAETTASGR